MQSHGWNLRKFFTLLLGFFIVNCSVDLYLYYKRSDIDIFAEIGKLKSRLITSHRCSPNETQILMHGKKLDTVKGTMDYSEILKMVYEPFGYVFDENIKNCKSASTLFPLKYVTIECSAVFLSWKNINVASKITVETVKSPPREIPENLRDSYLMNGLAKLSSYYVDEIPAHLPRSLIEPWTPDLLEKHFTWYRTRNWSLLPYDNQCAALFFALKKFKPTGLTGMVIGSQTPWVEAMALFFGASKIVTAEYAPLNVQVKNIEYLHPLNLVKNWKSYVDVDFVVSFSSIEHSGLGRYGDAPDPFGDFRELQKIMCLLKKGGLLFLAVPCGLDEVAYNAHRIYGYIRLPMLAAGFEYIGAFYGTDETMFENVPLILKTDYAKQYLFILRKK